MKEQEIYSSAVGFIISHPFHLSIYGNLAKHFRNPVFIIETRKKEPFDFSAEFLASVPGDVVTLKTDELTDVDGMLDVVFALTPVHVLSFFSKTKVVALQYSLSKEVYQYGLWRSIADLNITFGPYSFERVRGHCIAAVGGNPRFDKVPRKTPGGEGLLYMPTYGELSSLSTFAQALPLLPSNMKIKVKTHHASEFKDAELIRTIALDERVQIVDGYHDGLSEIAAADMVLSDYSGSIFDALYMGKPVALLQVPFHQSRERTSSESIEIARAQEIGPVARNAVELLSDLEGARDPIWDEKRQRLVDELFAYQGCSAERIASVTHDMLTGRHEPALSHRIIRNTYRDLIQQNRSLRKNLASSASLFGRKKVKRKSLVGRVIKAGVAGGSMGAGLYSGMVKSIGNFVERMGWR